MSFWQSVSYLVVSLELLEPLSVDHRPHLVLQLPHLLPPPSGFLLKALIGVLQLLHLITGIELCMQVTLLSTLLHIKVFLSWPILNHKIKKDFVFFERYEFSPILTHSFQRFSESVLKPHQSL